MCWRGWVLAWDGAECIGATTALPLAATQAEVRAPFEQAELPVEKVLYFGESVVRAGYRGRGIGVQFFNAREAHARGLRLSQCAFCSVERSTDHPLLPKEYVPNDAFWTRRGYRHHPELASVFEWRDLDQAAATKHRLSYWLKTL